MGLTLEQWEACDPEYYRLRMEGIARRERQRDREEWNRARWITARLLSIHTVKPVKDTDLIEWPDEKAARIKAWEDLRKAMNEDKRFAKTITITPTTDEQSN
jgi:hypothetical protein